MKMFLMFFLCFFNSLCFAQGNKNDLAKFKIAVLCQETVDNFSTYLEAPIFRELRKYEEFEFTDTLKDLPDVVIIMELTRFKVEQQDFVSYHAMYKSGQLYQLLTLGSSYTSKTKTKEDVVAEIVNKFDKDIFEYLRKNTIALKSRPNFWIDNNSKIYYDQLDKDGNVMKVYPSIYVSQQEIIKEKTQPVPELDVVYEDEITTEIETVTTKSLSLNGNRQSFN